MLSVLHEVLVRLFRERPELAPELLRDALGMELPAYSEVRTESADFTQIVPADYRADLVVLLVDDRPVLALVTEVQLWIDARKRRSWPLYAAAAGAQFRCDACVLVVTPSAKVARWAGKAIEIGPGSSMRPLVLGPDVIPAVRSIDAARGEPELAVLSAMAHGRDPDPEDAAQIALAALVACLDLDPEHATLYADVVRTALGEAARAALESLMQSPERREFQSEFARKYVSLGRAEGKAEGKAEGEAKGKAEGKAQAVLVVLDARALAVSTEQRERILACADIPTLERWIRRATTAASAEELFG
jgi:hypothetical protein